MSTTNPFSDRLREPLNETTRKTRRNLLAASVIGVVISKVGLVPAKISAFGIEFTSANQESLILLLAFSIAYFGITFVVYLYSELIAWQLVFRSKELENLKEEAKRDASGLRDDRERFYNEKARHTYFQARPTFFIRIFVELAIPIIFAIYSGIALLETKPAPVSEPVNKALNSQVGTPKSGAH